MNGNSTFNGKDFGSIQSFYKKKPMQKAYSFDKETTLKIVKGAAIAGGALFLTQLLEYASTLDFGEYSGLVVALLSILINMVKEWAKGE